jgi:hypothetical protein
MASSDKPADDLTKMARHEKLEAIAGRRNAAAALFR